MDNLPIETKENIFTRMKNFFKNIFKKDKKVVEVIEETKENNYNDEILNSYKKEINKLREDVRKTENINYIIERVDKDPSIIHSLPNERLIQLSKLYDEKIKYFIERTNELNKKLSFLEEIH